MHGPGFAVSDVVIHEDPSFGAEPAAYVINLEIFPRFLSLLRGRLEIASMRLEEPSLNLARNAGGPWNLQHFLAKTGKNPGRAARLPEIRVRGGRLNFRLDNVKSIFYITNADLDVVPPDEPGGAYSLRFSGEPARTDRAAQGLGRLTGRMQWEPEQDKVSLSAELEKSPIADLTVLTIGRDLGIHGLVSARARLAGGFSQLELTGSVEIGDVHRWDLMAGRGDAWPLNVKGVVDLDQPAIIVWTVPGKRGESAVALRFRAVNWLTRPAWAIVALARELPVAALAATMRHIGVALPPQIEAQGVADAVVGYSSRHGLHGQVLLRDLSLSAVELQPLQVPEYGLVIEGDSLRLKPATLRFADSRAVLVEGSFRLDSRSHNLKFVTPLFGIAETARLGSILGITNLPLLNQCRDGNLRGTLVHNADADGRGEWHGSLEIRSTVINLPNFSEPLQLAAGSLRLQPARTVLDRMRGTLGGIDWRGEYRYEVGAPRPHRFRISAPEVDLDRLRQLAAPVLGGSQGLLARTLGIRRAQLPEWLLTFQAEGSLAVERVVAGASRLENARANVSWEGSRVEFRDAQTRIGGVPVSWDAWTDLSQAPGLTGSFRVSDPPLLEELAPREVSGEFIWSMQRGRPLWRFRPLQVTTSEETFQGEGGSLPDGTLRFTLKGERRAVEVLGTLEPFALELVAEKGSN
jgi:hypothetical protein